MMKLPSFLTLTLLLVPISAFVSPKLFLGLEVATPSSSKLHVERDADGNIKKGPLEFLMDPKPTKIPPELRDEIYKAEANTEAARQRQGRIFNYGIIALVLVACAFANVFLTELRSSVAEETGAPVTSLEDIGWGWVNTNFLFQFIFSTKIGGGVALIGGATSGMMVEAEQDSQRKNAEEIWEELERRRANKSKPSKKKKNTGNLSKKKQSNAQKKRLAALSEVVLQDEVVSEADRAHDEGADVAEKDEGLMGKLKSWYDQADSMAASQALLLNKELEDRGVLDKITDESGLKVIGKDAAKNLKTGDDRKIP